MSRVKSFERIQMDERGDRRRQGTFISCKSKTGNNKKRKPRRGKK